MTPEPENGVEKSEVPQDTQVMIGQPANYPQAQIDALSRLFKKTKDVKQAYVALFYNPETGEKPHTLIAIEVTGNWDDVIEAAVAVAGEAPSPDPPTDFIQIAGQGGLEDYFLNECKPFYKRKRFGIL